MSVYSNIHFCLYGPRPEVKGRAHPDLPDIIEVLVRVGNAEFVISGPSGEVRSVLAEMHTTAQSLKPLPVAADALEEAP